jgi:RNA polymerase sigma-70 factor (ECF subfamily)
MIKKSVTNTRSLVQRILAGDANAFQAFVQQYQQLVAHIVFRMVSNTADREDLCQDVFLKAYQNLARFRFESKVSTWIAKIAYNTCINHLQKKKVPLYNDTSYEDDSIDNISGDRLTPEVFTEGKDTADRIQDEINRMDVRYRTVLTLYHLDGMSYAEIGKIMKLPEGTVKSYLFRARKNLKEKLLLQYQREEL